MAVAVRLGLGLGLWLNYSPHRGVRDDGRSDGRSDDPRDGSVRSWRFRHPILALRHPLDRYESSDSRRFEHSFVYNKARGAFTAIIYDKAEMNFRDFPRLYSRQCMYAYIYASAHVYVFVLVYAFAYAYAYAYAYANAYAYAYANAYAYEKSFIHLRCL